MNATSFGIHFGILAYDHYNYFWVFVILQPFKNYIYLLLLIFFCFRFRENLTIVWSSTMRLKGLWIKIPCWVSLWMGLTCFVMQDLNWSQALLRYEVLKYKHPVKLVAFVCFALMVLSRALFSDGFRDIGWLSVQLEQKHAYWERL